MKWNLSIVFFSFSIFCRSNAVILVYLSLDAAHVGVLSSFWSTAFLTEKLPRMILMIILFPLISLSLCSWMTIFGFYLKLEEKAWNRSVVFSILMFYVFWILKKFLTKTKGYFLSKNETLYIVFFRIKRKRKKEKLEKILTSEWIKSHSKEDLTDVSLSFVIYTENILVYHSSFIQKIFSNLDWH